MQLHGQHIATTAEGGRRHRETQKILAIIRRREGQRLARHHINQSIARPLHTIDIGNHPVIPLETQSSRRDRRIHRKREGMTEINGSVPVDRIAKRQDRGFVILAIPQLSRSFHPRRIIKIRMLPMRGIITRLPRHHVASPQPSLIREPPPARPRSHHRLGHHSGRHRPGRRRQRPARQPRIRTIVCIINCAQGAGQSDPRTRRHRAAALAEERRRQTGEKSSTAILPNHSRRARIQPRIANLIFGRQPRAGSAVIPTRAFHNKRPLQRVRQLVNARHVARLREGPTIQHVLLNAIGQQHPVIRIRLLV